MKILSHGKVFLTEAVLMVQYYQLILKGFRWYFEPEFDQDAVGMF